MSDGAVRRLVVWCPDWPVVAASREAGRSPVEPVAVFDANRVLACSETARSHGVRRGMRRREAQGRCPELAVHEHDPTRDARLFEPVAAAVESLAPGVEVVRPGLVSVPAKGPAGYFGSEEVAAERIVDQVGALAGAECQAGVADGLFAAVLAARRGVLVGTERTGEFLEPLRIEEIDQPAEQRGADRSGLVDLLRRLGIRTLGEFAALDPSDVVTRFGEDALVAHRAARGVEHRPPGRRRPPPELEVVEHLDPPVDQVDAAAFAAKNLAEDLHDKLRAFGLSCTRLGVSARTERDEELHRVWRCDEPLTPSGTANRVRWQLDGWLNGRDRPTAAVRVLSLRPAEVVGAGGLQLDLFRSTTGDSDARAGRAFVRVQGMLGPEAVLTGVLGGGRDAWDRVTFVPWGEQRRPAQDADQPWPGRLPPPSPQVVPDSPWSASVLDERGRPVEVTERQELSSAPRSVVSEGGRSRTVAEWAGPWPVEERWWDVERGAGDLAPGAPRLALRMQVVLAEDSTSDAGESALLLVREDARWWIRGAYR